MHGRQRRKSETVSWGHSKILVAIYSLLLLHITLYNTMTSSQPNKFVCHRRALNIMEHILPSRAAAERTATATDKLFYAKNEMLITYYVSIFYRWVPTATPTCFSFSSLSRQSSTFTPECENEKIISKLNKHTRWGVINKRRKKTKTNIFPLHSRAPMASYIMRDVKKIKWKSHR